MRLVIFSTWTYFSTCIADIDWITFFCQPLRVFSTQFLIGSLSIECPGWTAFHAEKTIFVAEIVFLQLV